MRHFTGLLLVGTNFYGLYRFDINRAISDFGFAFEESQMIVLKEKDSSKRVESQNQLYFSTIKVNVNGLKPASGDDLYTRALQMALYLV